MSEEIPKPLVCLPAKICAFENCAGTFVPGSNRQKFCSPRCGRMQRYLPKKLVARARRNVRFKIRTRDFALGFDGRHGGNLNVSYTTPILQ